MRKRGRRKEVIALFDVFSTLQVGWVD